MTTIVRKAVSGDPGQLEDLPSDVISGVKANTPFLNLFYARAAMDYLIFYRLQEATNPGSVARYEKRVERETGAGWLARPTDFDGA